MAEELTALFQCLCGAEYSSGFNTWADGKHPWELHCPECKQKREAEAAARRARAESPLEHIQQMFPCSGNCGREILYDCFRRVADGRILKLRHYCPECAAKISEEENAAEREHYVLSQAMNRVRRTSEWSLFCPPTMRETFLWQKSKTHHTKLSALLGWQYGSPRGIFVYGETAHGKTRAMYSLMTRLYIEENINVQVHDVSLAQRVAAIAANDSHRAYEFLRAAQTAPVLFIDELTGKGNFTPTYKQFLFAVLDYRDKWQLPTFATENNDAARIRARAGDDIALGDPLIERIKRSCQTICFDDQPLT